MFTRSLAYVSAAEQVVVRSDAVVQVQATWRTVSSTSHQENLLTSQSVLVEHPQRTAQRRVLGLTSTRQVELL